MTKEGVVESEIVSQFGKNFTDGFFAKVWLCLRWYKTYIFLALSEIFDNNEEEMLNAPHAVCDGKSEEKINYEFFDGNSNKIYKFETVKKLVRLLKLIRYGLCYLWS